MPNSPSPLLAPIRIPIRIPLLIPMARRALGMALAAIALAPSPAAAHAILEASQPPAKATVKAGTTQVHLRYNSRIDRARSVLTLIRPDKTRVTVAIDPDGPPEAINATLDLPPGRYVLRWQVLAIDGHITRGDLPFSVTGP